MSQTSQKTVLVVDDEEGIREILQSELEDAGYRVFTAESGNAGIEIIKKEKIDLVLSDIRMPNGTGTQLLKMIRERDAERPVVLFISGFSDVSLEEAYDLGAEGIMSKPWDPEELLKTIERLVATVPVRWKRQSDRFPIDWRVSLSLEGAQNIHATVINIGLGGMFVALASVQPKFEEYVDFAFLTGDLAGISGKGSVRWIRPSQNVDQYPGFGLEFLLFHDQGQAKFNEFLKNTSLKKPKG